MFGNMGDMMKQVGDMKKQMKKLKKLQVEVASSDEMVKVRCNGEMKIISVEIDENASLKKLPITVRDTVNKALHEVKMKSVGEMKGMEGLGLPGM
jgi:DNA-binding protein YbaB